MSTENEVFEEGVDGLGVVQVRRVAAAFRVRVRVGVRVRVRVWVRVRVRV